MYIRNIGLQIPNRSSSSSPSSLLNNNGANDPSIRVYAIYLLRRGRKIQYTILLSGLLVYIFGPPNTSLLRIVDRHLAIAADAWNSSEAIGIPAAQIFHLLFGSRLNA